MVLLTDWQETVQKKELSHFVSTGHFDITDIYKLIHMAIKSDAKKLQRSWDLFIVERFIRYFE